MIEEFTQEQLDFLIPRLGSIGGTGIDEVMGGYAVRWKYMSRLAAEWVTREPSPYKKFKWSDRGLINEGPALNLFAYRYGFEVKQGVTRRRNAFKHVSLDASVIGEDAFCEVKTRLPATWIENDGGKIPPKTGRQIQWAFNVTGKKLCYYIQYCPEMPLNKLKVQEVGPDYKLMDEMDKAADKFFEEMKPIIIKYGGEQCLIKPPWLQSIN